MPEHAFISIPLTRTREGLASDRDYGQVIRDRASDDREFVLAIALHNLADQSLSLIFTRKGSSP